MLQLFKLVLILFFLNTTLYSYESENRLETLIVGKVAKYISWNKEISNNFVITILNNEFGSLFEEIYLNKKIKSKPVKIKYIDNIYELNNTDILFISKLNNNLEEILEYTKNKNILTISDKRGFAQRGGILQFYFVGQRLKLRLNINVMQREGFMVDRTLLKIVDIVKREVK